MLFSVSLKRAYCGSDCVCVSVCVCRNGRGHFSDEHYSAADVPRPATHAQLHILGVVLQAPGPDKVHPQEGVDGRVCKYSNNFALTSRKKWRSWEVSIIHPTGWLRASWTRMKHNSCSPKHNLVLSWFDSVIQKRGACLWLGLMVGT